MLQHIIIILGPPGSGKGTQGKMLVPILNYDYFSMGQYLRNYSLKNTDLAKQVKVSIDNGEILPDDLFEQIFPEVMNDILRSGGVIFDGFPRDEAQLPVLEQILSDNNISDIKVIFLDVPRTKLLGRLHLREKKEDRTDDEPEVIGVRFDEYMNKSLPVIRYFEKKGWLVKIDGNQPVEKVHQEIVSKLGLSS